MFIPGNDMVGGYSMCSSPRDLIEQHTFDLAIKKSDYPPTRWMIENVRTLYHCEFGVVFSSTCYVSDVVFSVRWGQNSTSSLVAV